MEDGFQGMPPSLELSEQMPFSLEAEQSVLGAILLDPSCILTVTDLIRPECFYREVNAGVYGAMLRMFTTGETIDIVTVLQAVMSAGLFDSEQDAKLYLTRLAQVVPSTGNVDSYARIVQEKFYLRSLITAAREIINTSSEGYEDPQRVLDAAEQKIYDIRQGRDTKGLRKIDEIIVTAYDRLQQISGDDRERFLGLPTGFTLLDHMIMGLNKSDLILIAGRPGMGKTTFAINIATNVALKSNQTVAVFSLEMSAEQIVTKILSAEASIESNAFRTGALRAEDWVRLATAADRLSRAPIYIDDTAGITVTEIKSRLRRLKDVGLVVIDYLQLMTSGKGRGDNRVQEVSEITRSLKIMARELDVPVITASQLSRGPESRTDHRPMLSDLRESGSIEQDADIVMFLFRDAYYNRESEEPNVGECIVAKNRHGETGTAQVSCDMQFSRFGNLERFRYE